MPASASTPVARVRVNPCYINVRALSKPADVSIDVMQKNLSRVFRFINSKIRVIQVLFNSKNGVASEWPPVITSDLQ